MATNRAMSASVARGGAADHHHFERGANLEQILDEVGVDRAHAGASIGLHHHQPLALQLAQCFANRHVTYTVAGGQRVDRNARPKRERTSDDVVSDAQADVEACDGHSDRNMS